MAFEIALSGKAELDAALLKFEQATGHPRPALERIYATVVEPTLRNTFAQQGPGWSALNPLYAKWKAIRFPGQPILQASGRGYRTLLRGIGTTFVLEDTALTFKSDTVPHYMAFHQTGTKRMPARPWLNFGPQQAQTAQQALGDWLREQGRADGFAVSG